MTFGILPPTPKNEASIIFHLRGFAEAEGKNPCTREFIRKGFGAIQSAVASLPLSDKMIVARATGYQSTVDQR